MANELIAEAITDYLGERCLDYAEGCPTCEAWAEYDRLYTRRGAAVEGLETWKFHAPHNGSAKMIQNTDGDYVTRSQAEAIIAAKDKKYADTEAAHKTLIDVKNSIIEGLAKNLFVFAQDTGSSMAALEADNAALVHDLNRIKDHETKLVNDNAELTARVKELSALIDGENCADPDKIDALFRRAETAETQLAARNKVLTDIQCIDWDGLSVSDVFDEINEIVERAALEVKP